MALPIASTMSQIKPLSPRKSVSFNSFVKFKEVEIISRATGHDLWWTSQDFSAFRRRDRQVARQMSDGEHIFDECTRGLESKTRDGCHRRKFHRIQAWLGVLDEQEYQWEQAIHDEEIIAELYHKMCEQAAEDACDRGLKDEEYVRQTLELANTKNYTKNLRCQTILVLETIPLEPVHRRFAGTAA